MPFTSPFAINLRRIAKQFSKCGIVQLYVATSARNNSGNRSGRQLATLDSLAELSIHRVRLEKDSGPRRPNDASSSEREVSAEE